MPDYVSTDPNYGAVTPDYVSTDPNYGLPHVNVRTAVYGPVVGERYRDAMFGPEGNPLGPDDLALSEDDQQTFPRGSKVQVNGQGKVYTVADSSYRRPGQPNSHTVEFRDQASPPPQVTLTPAPQPQSQPSYVSTDPNYGLVNPAIKQAGADAMAQPPSMLDRFIDLAKTPSPAWLQPAEQRAKAFVEGAGVPSSLEEVKQFVTRNPIQDIKDIYGDVVKIPERIENFGQTLSTSPAATVVRDPLSKEAFGVYGTAAGMLAPGAHEMIKEKAGLPAAEASSEPRTTETNAAPASPASAPEAEKAPDTAPAPEAPGSIQDFGPSYARYQGPGKIVAAALKMDNGQIATGPSHPHAWQNALDSGIASQVIDSGYINDKGEFVKTGERSEKVLGPTEPPKTLGSGAQPVDETGKAVTLPPDEEAATSGTPPAAVASATDSAYGRAVAAERPEQAPVGEAASVAERTEPAASGEVGASQDFGQHGVSRAARAASDEVDITPAEIYSAEDHIQNGRKLVSEGADTDAVVAEALKRGSFGRDAIDLAVNRDAELTKAARVARRAADDARDMRQTPNDGVLEKTAREAELKQQQWEDRVIRPIRGQFADTGHALQTAIDLNTGDAIDYVKTFRQQAGREPNPVERTKIDRQAANVRRVRDAQDADVARRAERASKGATKKLDRKQLRSFLDKLHEELFKDCAT